MEKICSTCRTKYQTQDKESMGEFFYKKLLSSDGLDSVCKFCRRKINGQQYKKTHPTGERTKRINNGGKYA